MNIYERLTQDHDAQRELAEKISATTGDSEERRELYARLKIELEAHANAEEQTLYAALIEKPETQEQARHSVSEHLTLNDLIDELDDIDMGVGAWLQKFKTLQHDLIHHLDEEEKDVFSKARKLIPDQKARRLGSEFEQRKQDEKAA